MKTTRSKRNGWGAWGVTVVLLMGVFAASSLWAQSANSIQVNVAEAVTVPVENVAKLAVAEPAIADVAVLSDKEISVIGKKVGVTTLAVVHTEGRPTVVYKIEVGNETAAAMIRQMIGSNTITVRAIGDTLVLDGKVNDEIEAQRAVQVATAYKPQVLNLLEIKKPRQIRIRTRIAEVNTEAVKNIGFQWFGPQGQVQYAMQYMGGGSIINGFIPTKGEFGTEGSTIQPNTATLTLLLDMLITKSYARLLSEPTLVTFSGKEASFLVGEEVPIVQQLPQSFTVEFKDVGVRMKIKPTADSENRINTTIHAEVSQVVGIGANSIPIIGAKTVDTTLQVNDGQTIVIGGLLENNIGTDILRKLPWLADIPVFGLLFRDKQFDQAKREVLFFMTPEVVKDVDADAAAAAKTPVMQRWISQKDKAIFRSLDKQDDWGLHRLDGMGFSGREDADKADRDSQSAAHAKPGTTPVPKEPTTNFQPTRPAGS
jgi:pilus assembly protein CpaC